MAKRKKIKELDVIEIETIKELRGECITNKQVCETFDISIQTLFKIWDTITEN